MLLVVVRQMGRILVLGHLTKCFEGCTNFNISILDVIKASMLKAFGICIIRLVSSVYCAVIKVILLLGFKELMYEILKRM
jgi:hypothetical protein